MPFLFILFWASFAEEKLEKAVVGRCIYSHFLWLEAFHWFRFLSQIPTKNMSLWVCNSKCLYLKWDAHCTQSMCLYVAQWMFIYRQTRCLRLNSANVELLLRERIISSAVACMVVHCLWERETRACRRLPYALSLCVFVASPLCCVRMKHVTSESKNELIPICVMFWSLLFHYSRMFDEYTIRVTRANTFTSHAIRRLFVRMK